MPLFLGAQNNIDSTKQGYFRAQISLFCKNTFDFRNTFSRKKYNNAIKNSDNLVLPESCKNYNRTFVDSFNIFDQTKYILKYIYKLINAECYPEVKNCFNIYGFDIMILDDFTVKIIENNINPGLGYPQEFFDLMFEKNIDCFLEPENPQPKVNNYIEL